MYPKSIADQLSVLVMHNLIQIMYNVILGGGGCAENKLNIKKAGKS